MTHPYDSSAANANAMQEIDNKPDPRRIVNGLRDAGYNLNTAIADIVDNSINARADNVHVRLTLDPAGEAHVSIHDDGYGMDREELVDALRYGSREKTEGNELGKYGLGLKTASTSACRQVSVVTRNEDDGPLIEAVLDLDLIGVGENEYPLFIGKASTASQAEFENVLSGSGTMVRWDKVDRLGGLGEGEVSAKALGQYKRRLRSHLEVTFHRFLERDLKLWLDDELLEPKNPFMPGEDVHLFLQEEVALSEICPDPRLPSGASFRLKAHVIPSVYEYSSEAALKKAGISTNRQGFYVFRRDRMIVPHDWFGVFIRDQHLSLARIALEFDPELDEFFRLDVKKSHFNLDPIKGHLKSLLSSFAREAQRRYREARRRHLAGREREINPHGPSQELLAARYDSVTEDLELKPVDDQNVVIANDQGETLVRLPSATPEEDNQVVLVEDGIEDDLFWSPRLMNGRIGVAVNRSHPYYERVYVPNYSDSVVVRGLDSLLWALSKCEQEVVCEQSRSSLEELRKRVSRTLADLAEALPEPPAPKPDAETF